MKKIQLLTLLAALCLAACTGAGDRVIDRPAFKAVSSTDLLPVKVEQSREATVVHFHIRCADWRNWSMTGARLEADGKTFACLRGIEAMDPLKKELEGKDVVFVYLTDESSFMKDWTENVLKIPGLHYRIPTSKWKEISIPGGIPQYYLYDRKGQRVWEQTGFSDKVLEDIKKQIDQVLD